MRVRSRQSPIRRHRPLRVEPLESRLALAPLAALPQLLADINAGGLSAAPGSAVVIGSVSYFAANDSTNGVELWKTDGTTAGTTLVKDIQPGPGSSNPQSLTVFGGKLYFRANDGTHGDEIWQSDGTLNGTKLVTDLAPGSQSFYPGNFAISNNKLYFTASDNDPGQTTFYGPSPYLSAADSPFNRSQLGTDFWLEDFEDGKLNTPGVSADYGAPRVPGSLTDSVDADDGQIDNSGLDGHSYLVRPGMTGVTFTFSRTTLGGLPTNVGIVLTGGGDDSPGMNVEFFDAGGNLIGTTNDMFPKPTSGVTSDDRFVGMTHAGGICAIRISGVLAPSNTGIELDHLQYGAIVPAIGSMQLWATDGSESGTKKITDLRNQPKFSAADLNDTLYFTGSTPTAGIELWKIDENGPVQVMDINPGTANSNPRALTVVDGTLYFVAGDGVHGNELWKLDANGPALVKDINPGLAHAEITSLAVLAGKLLFSANDGTNGSELWQSDGTENGTVLLKDIKSGSDSSSPAQFANVNGTIFFSADDGTHFVELWKTDGTAAGTVMVKDIAPGSRSSRLQALTGINDTLYFAASDDQTGLELWQSDGTTAGTTLVADLNTSDSSAPRNIVKVNNHLVFTANDGLHGWEPFTAQLVPGDVTTGLVHRWTFDETAGDTAHDGVGGSDGTLVNWASGEPKWESGRVGGALRFDSADNYVIAPNPGMTGSFALSFWLNLSSRDGAYARIVTPKSSNVVFVANDLGKGVSYTQNDNSFTYSAEPPTFNTWEHYAINFNSATGQAVIFRSGAPVGIGSFADSASLQSWVFGHNYDLNNGDHSLAGSLDDFRVYDRVLKDEDIAQLASLGVAAPVHQEPIHHWTFDETTGFTAFDSAGGANGTLVNWNQTEPRWEPGRVGGALRFSTADDAVVTPLIGMGAQWSMAFWLNVTAKTGVNPRIVTGTDNSALANLLFEFNGGVSITSGNINTFDTKPITVGSWNHYAITYDTIADVGTIYRNGTVVASGFFWQNSPAFAWVFGHNYDLTNHGDSLNGLLDDLRVYDRLLTPGEIADLALTGDPQPVPTSLTHLWTFDETTGDIAADIVGGNDGVLRNWSASEGKWVTGKIGRAISFNDADDLILTQSPITQDQYTFSFWLNQTGEGGFNPRIITPGDHREDWVIISQFGNKGVGFAGSDAQDPKLPVRNTWEQYVVTLDRVSGQAAVFRNGVKVDTGTFHELPALLPWYMGHHSELDTHIDTLQGLLDDMRIYDRVLTDSEAMRLATGNFVLATNDNYAVQEDALLSVSQALGVLANDSNLNTNSKTTLEANAQHGIVDLKVDGRFTYKPNDNYLGPDSFVYRLTDNLGNFVLATVALTVNPVNDAPTFTKGPNLQASDEQGALTHTTTIRFDDLTGAPDNLFYHYTEGDFTVSADVAAGAGRWIEAHDPSHITGNPAPALYGDEFGATLEIKRSSGGTFALAGFDLASWEFDFFATDSPVQYTVEGLLNGQTLYASTGQVVTSDFHTITGLPGNPIDTLRFHMIRVDSQAYILDNIRLVTEIAAPPSVWATEISTGASDESSQKLNFFVTTDKPELFEIQPALDPSGKLTFVPKANANGLATVSVALHDNGGTANGGTDTSPTQTFTINIVKNYPWHNVAQSNDVDGDGEVTASDVITIINYINAGLPNSPPGGNQPGHPNGYLDADADNSVSASDALAVINAINAAPAKPAATFQGVDTTTQGTWIGKYGNDGYALNSGPTSLPAYAQLSFKSGLTEIYDYVSAESTTDVRALQKPSADDRIAAAWTGDYGFIIDLNLQSSQPHRVALYMLNWTDTAAYQRIEIIDANTGALLDTQTVDEMHSGKYLAWTITGHVKIRFSNLANGINAFLNAIFLG